MQIADYIVQKKLQQGRRFAIYRAVKEDNTTPRVLKVLDKKTVRDFTTIPGIKHEYSLLREIDTQYVIKAIDWIDHKDYAVLVLEDIGGKPIKDEMEKRLFPIQQFIELAIQTTKGLVAIHGQNIIHKDINPSNIIWNSQTGRLRIIDFSIASKFDAKVSYSGNPEKLQGTLPYISPEQTGRMNRRVDQRSDLYSLGVTFYQMLTGKLPFQQRDPMKVVYAHLARAPTPPYVLNKQVPHILSKLVLRLLAKNPEDRYQSARGVIHDLEKARKFNFSDFKLGEKDFSGKLQIPEKLYGREKEIKLLLNAYQRVSKGAKEMILSVGHSGTGKTVLVNEIHKAITRDQGYFISGKFEQLQRNVPYFAFIQAIRQFCDLILTEDQANLNIWKKIILESVGQLGKILTDIIPNLEHIIGKQPDVPQIDGKEAKDRFNYVFQRFLRDISTQEHPLILFIDDLQWADFASLELWQLLMTETQNRFFLFVGAFRDNEVSPEHLLTVTIEELHKQKVTISTIPVKNLSRKNIQVWLLDTLRNADHRGSQDIEDLSNHIYRKTQGNAFFTVQFLENLYKEGLLTFDSSRSEWTWAINEIDRLDITDNVVDLLVRRIKSLPHGVQEALKLSSCIGNIFDAATLSVITDKDIHIRESLEMARHENLIYPLDDITYKFGHDRIQQAAYALISDNEKKPVHLKIGRILLEEFPILEETGTLKVSEKIDQRIFDIVNHFNMGINLVPDEEEKIKIVKLNLKAAQKAMSAVAYQPGWEYIQQALLLLPKDSWQKHYDFTLSIHNKAVQLAYLSGKYAEMERLGDIVLESEVKVSDKSIVYEYRIMSLTAQNEFTKAVDTALELLAGLGINIPRKPDEQDMSIFAETKALLEKKGVQALKNYPSMKDEEKKLAMRLYLRTSYALSLADQGMLFPFVVNRMMLLSLQYGETPETPFLFTDYSMMSIFTGNFHDATKYSHLSIEMLRKLKGFESMKVRMLTHTYGYVLPWSVPYKELPDLYWELYQRAIQVGDLEYAAWDIAGFFIFSRYICEKLTLEEQVGKRILETIRQLKQPIPGGLIEIWQHVIESLTGSNQDPMQFNIDFEKSIPTITEDIKRLEQFYKAESKIFLNCIFGNDEFFDCSDILKKSVILTGVYVYPNYIIYSTLLKLQVIKKKCPDQKQKLLDEVNESLGKIKEWADFGPRNFLHRYYLIQAELSNIHGNMYEAGEYYDKAIETANQNEFLCDESLSNELAAKFYLKNQREPLAVFYFRKAYQCYRNWGALAKVKHMEENYPKYLSMSVPGLMLGTGTISSASTGTADELLDVKTIIKASQTLSGEVQLDNLLEKMMQILVENAGAQKSMLIENIDGRLFVQAEGSTDGVSGLLMALPVDQSQNVPLSIINYAARSKQQLVFENVSKDPNYSSDDYIQEHQPKSVVCFPVLSKGELSAIIYLENNMVEGAFTPERMNVLNTLSSQIAISMENARVYRELDELNKGLEQKVVDRTKEIAEKNQKLEQQSLQLKELDQAKSRFFANISHEFRTPLTLIMGPLEQMLNKYTEPMFQKQAHIMMRNSQRLLNQVNQLLELAKFDSGALQLHASRQDIVSFVKNIVACFQPLARQEKIDLQVHCLLDEIMFYFDADKLEKVLSNLLANAFNYTPQDGEVFLTIKLLTSNPQIPGPSTAISIRDSGSGIPARHLPHIFDRFFRVEGNAGYKRKGTGIGLALTKELVELHQGIIEVNSNCEEGEKQGTEFIIYLPMGKEHLEPFEVLAVGENVPQLVAPPLTATKFAGCTINQEREEDMDEESGGKSRERKPLVLVADDNADVRSYIKSALEVQFRITQAADGKEALIRAKDHIPDLIISDVVMPEKDGFQLCRTLKEDILTSHIPIILLTARVDESSEIEGLECGADDYIKKPFPASVLLERVKNLIRLRSHLQQVRKNRLALRPVELPMSTLDNQFYKALQETIHNQLSDPDLNVESLAEKMEMSQVTLYRKIQGLTGKTPVQLIRDFRLNRAAHMLEAGSGTVASIAGQVGFSSLSYFSKCFRQQFKCLPSYLLERTAAPDSLSPKEAPAAPVQDERQGNDKALILLVEDNDDARFYIKESLESLYRILESVSGNQGITLAREVIPDLIVSDVMMPGTDGFELCRVLKNDRRTAHIPIVLLTARASEESIIKGLETGADDYIVKPFNAGVLQARIKNLIDLRNQLHLKRHCQLALLPAGIEESATDKKFAQDLEKAMAGNHSDPDFTVQQLADALYMSSASLYRKINALTGGSFRDYIRDYRLNRAANLLKKGFGSVTEVAFEVGFKSRAHFTRCFKEKFHTLPSTYFLAEARE